jgi:nitrogen fixation protein NifB
MPENLRVAVASSQGKSVDLHFGHADQFLVFDVAANRVEFIDTRHVRAVEDDLEGVEDLDLAVESIGDCQVVLSMRAGPHAQERLLKHGIRSIEHAGTLIAGLTEVRSMLAA